MDRAASPVLGVVLLTGLTLVLAGVAGVVAMDMAPATAPGSSSTVAEPLVLSASADATTGRIVLVHESGPTIDVRAVRIKVSVGGTPLDHQPPVPFSGAVGFRWAPTGPFNQATDPHWEVGERASLRVAGTNEPGLTSGVTVRIEVYRDDRPIASVRTTAS